MGRFCTSVMLDTGEQGNGIMEGGEMDTMERLLDPARMADMGLVPCCLIFLFIGLVMGLFIGSREASRIGNMICGMVGALLLGALFIVFYRDFYGVIGSIIASIFGAGLFLFIKWGLSTYKD